MDVNIVDNHQLEQVLFQVPNSIFWKDKNSIFLGANSQFVSITGLSCIESLKGKTDFDMPWAKTHAEVYRTYDLEIFKGKTIVNQIETQLQVDGKWVTVIVNKAPLLDKERRIMGVIGSFMELPITYKTQDKNSICLPKSQKTVLIHLARGLSAKEIACKMQLSPRTIEFYINILKTKFSCRSKAQLIAKIWQLNLTP